MCALLFVYASFCASLHHSFSMLPCWHRLAKNSSGARKLSRAQGRYVLCLIPLRRITPPVPGLSSSKLLSIRIKEPRARSGQNSQCQARPPLFGWSGKNSLFSSESAAFGWKAKDISQFCCNRMQSTAQLQHSLACRNAPNPGFTGGKQIASGQKPAKPYHMFRMCEAAGHS